MRPMRSVQSADVAIIGAGPYGLSAAAHLRAAGVDTLVFGEPMAFWANHMPIGMFLRSSKRASTIADPRRELTIERYEAERGAVVPNPVPLEDFIDYGRWFCGHAASDVDRRRVVRVNTEGGRFRL